MNIAAIHFLSIVYIPTYKRPRYILYIYIYTYCIYCNPATSKGHYYYYYYSTSLKQALASDDGTRKLAWCEHFPKDTTPDRQRDERDLIPARRGWWQSGEEKGRTDATRRRETLPEKRALFHIFPPPVCRPRSLGDFKNPGTGGGGEDTGEGSFSLGLLPSGEQAIRANADFRTLI